MASIEVTLRSGARFLTVSAFLWSLAYFYVYGTNEGSQWILGDLTVTLFSEYDISFQHGARLIWLDSPMLLASIVCLLIVTNDPLPRHFQAKINKIFVSIRSVTESTKEDCAQRKNQFGIGEINFNYIAIFLLVLPVLSFFLTTLKKTALDHDLSGEELLKATSNTAAIAGTLALSFFLIPVSRHSILLVALGWSPLQALRIHVWAGYVSFCGIVLHSLMYFYIYIRENSLVENLIPGSHCWEWTPETPQPKQCRLQWNNFSGFIAFVCMLILTSSSLNWFRRRYYRVFYTCHMIFAIGMLGTAVMHWRPIITIIAPSIIYYLASTMPVLVQAFTSRLRGGVRIVKIVHLHDANGCKELQVEANPETTGILDQQPSMYLKMCVPSISMIWHPFTVFKHPQDNTTVRILMRPVGPFTKALALRWEQEEDTAVILDGFYHTGNRCIEALQHDKVVIICGGVAITPFLSFIPNLLQEMAFRISNGQELQIQKIELHFTCREAGLANYLTENYLNGMKLAANAVGIDFEIIVYHTSKSGKPYNHRPLDAIDKDLHHEESPMETTFMSGSTMGPSVDVDEYAASMELDSEVPSSPAEHKERTMSSDRKSDIAQAVLYAACNHAMEPSRFMPARYDKVWKNVPSFIAVGGSMWLFFYIIFHYYNNYEVKVHETYDRLWSLIVCLLSAASLGTVFEVMHWIWRTFIEYKVETKTSRQALLLNYIEPDVESIELVKHLDGRPDITEIFRGMNCAAAPGVFVCGPPAMTNLVKKEAARENSLLGVTRYALYEDPFEM